MTEKRLLIDTAILREAYRKGDLSNLGWIRSTHSIADTLTKDTKESALHRVLATATLRTPVEQWIAEGGIPQHKNRLDYAVGDVPVRIGKLKTAMLK